MNKSLLNLTCTLFMLIQSSFTLYCQKNTLTDNIQDNAQKQDEFDKEFLYKDIYAYFRPDYQPSIYSKFIFQSDAPLSARKMFKHLFLKAGFQCVEYNEVFPLDSAVNKETINKIIADNNIDGFVTIGFQKDKYNRGIDYSGIAVENFAFGSSNAVTGSIVTLYIDFYDNQTSNEPFIHVIGTLKGGDGADIALCEKIFWLTLRELIAKELIFVEKYNLK